MDIREETRIAGRLLKSLRRGEIDRREFLQLSALLSGAAVMAACSIGGNSAAKKGTAIVPFMTSEDDPSSQQFYASAITAFEQYNPGIKIQIRYATETEQTQIINTALLTSTDVGIINGAQQVISDYIARHVVQPVTDIVNAIGKSDFLPQSRLIVNGDDWGIPYQINAFPLWYRTDLFQKAGFGAPQTYQDLLAATTALNGQNGIIGVSTTMGFNWAEYLGANFVYQSGWDYFSHSGQLTFDQPDVLAAVKRMTDWLKHTDKSMVNATSQTVVSAYSTGRAATAYYGGRMGVFLFGNAPKIDAVTDIVGLPAGDFMPGQVVYGNTAFYMLTAATKHPAEAKAFLQALTSSGNALAFALTVPGHLIPPLKSVQKANLDASNPLVATNAYMQKHSDRVAKIINLTPNSGNPVLNMGLVNNHKFLGQSLNQCPWSATIFGTSPPIDQEMFQQILLNNKDPEQAWTTAAAKMKQAADTWKAQNPTWKPPT